jgi:WXG100 family type VII secretion target
MSIFSVIADEVEEQVQQFSRQGQRAEQVVNTIRTNLQPIQNGAWTGQGGRAFIQEVVTRVVPQIMELIAAIAGFGGGIGKALNIMTNADKMVKGIVGQVSDVFSSIF